MFDRPKPQISYRGGDEASGNVVVVETIAPAGWELQSHRHKHAHTSVLVSGTADITIEGVTKRMTGYQLVTVPANSVHHVSAVTPIVWLCLWAGELAPREEIEGSLKLSSACGNCPGGCEPA
ncbi:short tail fiber adhesin [Xanthomonas phage Elanor]|uniref:Short tail fiber adhesin n=1 Tax=Xanthomonas phage Elanor TaxID=2939127 RepID=A0A9E7J5B6_9CAUD|nr:short tail fiber adhesin [Xanthomonas phage Elanor]URA07046.1 short tail fiber adhesin [Xanthomonas phage Elanor]